MSSLKTTISAACLLIASNNVFSAYPINSIDYLNNEGYDSLGTEIEEWILEKYYDNREKWLESAIEGGTKIALKYSLNWLYDYQLREYEVPALEWGVPYVYSILNTSHGRQRYNNSVQGWSVYSYPHYLSADKALDILEDPSVFQHSGSPRYEESNAGYEHYDGRKLTNEMDAKLRYSTQHKTVVISWLRNFYSTPCYPTNNSYDPWGGSSVFNFTFGAGGNIYDGSSSFNWGGLLKGVGVWLQDSYFSEAPDKVIAEPIYQVFRVVDGVRTNISRSASGNGRDYYFEYMGGWHSKKDFFFGGASFTLLDDISEVPEGAKIEYEVEGFHPSQRQRHFVAVSDGKKIPQGPNYLCSAESNYEHFPSVKSILSFDSDWDHRPDFYNQYGFVPAVNYLMF